VLFSIEQCAIAVSKAFRGSVLGAWLYLCFVAFWNILRRLAIKEMSSGVME